MRTHRAAVWSAVVAVAAWSQTSRAQAPELIRAGADVTWRELRVPKPDFTPRAAELPVPPEQPQTVERSLFEPARVSPFRPEALDPLLGSFALAERLDFHRTLLNRQLGALHWDFSMASDSEFKTKYLTFSRPQTLLLRRIEDLNRLRGEGIVVQIDANTQYRAKVSINIFNPVRGSTLSLDPVNGTQGPAHKIKTGVVLDAVKAHSYVFKAGGKEFWLLYGTDVDPKTDQFAATRSLVFVHEAGLDSKAWTLAEAQLTPDRPVAVDLGGTSVTLVRASDGTLRIHGR